MGAPLVRFTPDREDARQAAFAEHRRAWRAAYLRWQSAGRPPHLVLWFPADRPEPAPASATAAGEGSS